MWTDIRWISRERLKQKISHYKARKWKINIKNDYLICGSSCPFVKWQDENKILKAQVLLILHKKYAEKKTIRHKYVPTYNI